MKGKIGFVQQAQTDNKVKDLMERKLGAGVLRYSREGEVGKGFIYNCAFKQGDCVITAPPVHKTSRLKWEDVEGLPQFREFVSKYCVNANAASS